jgi:predicted Zn-dependent protease with MMP-like domain
MKKALIFASFLALTSCGSGGSNESALGSDTLKADSTNIATPSLSQEAVEGIVKTIPSPIETSVIIKKSGGEYNKNILNPTENSKNYSSSYKRALNLGVYGADLGYINIYEKNKESLYYLQSVKEMADGLNIGQFFDFETIKRMASSNKNADSLLNITTDNFNKINDFLFQQNRSDQSVLILLGGWIEGLNIMCETAVKSKNTKLYEKVGEQKIVIDQLVLLIANYESDANIKDLSMGLKNLRGLYEKVEITYTYKESKMEIVDGIPTIVDKSESKVNITEAQIVEIARVTKELRDKIIK